MSELAEKLKSVQEKIEAACVRARRSPDEVRLVTVTKTATPDQIREIIRLGQRELGENRVQHLKKIADEVGEFMVAAGLSGQVNWHMIGHLQRNKVRAIMGLVRMIHSVDTLRLAEEINAAAAKAAQPARILLEINAGGEVQKYGVPVGAAIHLAEQVATLPNLRLCGLMTVAPLTDDQETLRLCFSRMRDLFLEIRNERIAGSDFTQLSMGMSNDYEMAIEYGATIVRIGSAIFS